MVPFRVMGHICWLFILVFNPSPHNLNIITPEQEAFEVTVTSIFSFSHKVFQTKKDRIVIVATLNFLSTRTLDFVKSKSLFFGEGLKVEFLCTCIDKFGGR